MTIGPVSKTALSQEYTMLSTRARALRRKETPWDHNRTLTALMAEHTECPCSQQTKLQLASYYSADQFSERMKSRYCR